MGRISGLFQSRAVLDDALMDDLEEIFIESDMGVDTAMALMEGVRRRAGKLEGDVAERVRQALRQEVQALMPDPAAGEGTPSAKPHVTLVVGVNGTGKTTTIGKLAHGTSRRASKSSWPGPTPLGPPQASSWQSGPSGPAPCWCARPTAPIPPAWPLTA